MSTNDEAIWNRLSPQTRDWLKWVLWFVTWVMLLAGLFDRAFYQYVVWFTVGHAVLFLALHGFRPMVFPVQLRILYVVWVVLGTYAPYMVFLMYITTVGLPANLFFGYCPLARMMYLLPWNREERLSRRLLARIILTPSVSGRFKPTSGAAGG